MYLRAVRADGDARWVGGRELSERLGRRGPGTQGRTPRGRWAEQLCPLPGRQEHRYPGLSVVLLPLLYLKSRTLSTPYFSATIKGGGF